jgi:hypothetical protein
MPEDTYLHELLLPDYLNTNTFSFGFQIPTQCFTNVKYTITIYTIQQKIFELVL